MVEETSDGIRPWLDRILLLGRYEKVSPANGGMVSQTFAQLYLEMLEARPYSIQESYEMWHQQMAVMAMGKYSQRILAHS